MGLGCVRICVRKTFQNMTKWDKIGKYMKWKTGVIIICYGKLRRLGNSEVVTENPRVGSSILSLGTRIEKLRRHVSGAFSF